MVVSNRVQLLVRANMETNELLITLANREHIGQASRLKQQNLEIYTASSLLLLAKHGHRRRPRQLSAQQKRSVSALCELSEKLLGKLVWTGLILLRMHYRLAPPPLQQHAKAGRLLLTIFPVPGTVCLQPPTETVRLLVRMGRIPETQLAACERLKERLYMGGCIIL